MLNVRGDSNGLVEGWNLARIERFNDGTPHIRLDLATLSRCNTVSVLWTFEDRRWTEDLFDLQCVMDALSETHIQLRKVLEMPYVPNARMDRVKGLGEAFTLKTFARIINRMDFDSVRVLDPHSDVAVALIDRCEVKTPKQAFGDLHFMSGYRNPLWVFPDAGAMHRYNAILPFDDVTWAPTRVIFGEKTRDWDTQRITGYTLFGADEVKGSDVIIADDIIAHGWTLRFLLEELVKHEPASIRIYASHVENSFKDGPLYEMLKNGEIEATVYTTGSIKRDWEEDFVREKYFRGE